MTVSSSGGAGRLISGGLGNLLVEARRTIVESGRSTHAPLRGYLTYAPSPEEWRALTGFFGYRRIDSLREGNSFRIQLTALDAHFREILGEDLHTVLAEMGLLQSKGDQALSARMALEDAAERVHQTAPDSAKTWAAGLHHDSTSGRWFRRAFGKNQHLAEQVAVWVARAVGELPLPVVEHLAGFAARLTGDPHAFDASQPAGKLLLLALEEHLTVMLPDDDLPPAVFREQLLGLAGLAVDGISSDVTVANLNGTGHPVIEAMAQDGGPWKLPLYVTRGLALRPAPGTPAFILENPPVFEPLAGAIQHDPQRRLLVCTSGFPSAAAVLLLDRLHSAGYVLYYSGDFDGNGVTIAAGLNRRYPGMVLWRMTPADYQRACTGEGPRLSENDFGKLAAITGPLRGLADAMRERGEAAYQENLRTMYLTDLGHPMAG